MTDSCRKITCDDEYPKKERTSQIIYDGPTIPCLPDSLQGKSCVPLNRILKELCDSGSGSGTITGADNIGEGEGLFAQEEDGVLEFKSLIEGDGIDLDASSGEISISIDAAHLNGNVWTLTGNAGTSLGTNFLGTTDAVGLEFRVNNERAGLITYSANFALGNNTFFGMRAGEVANPATTNALIGIGYEALLNTVQGGSLIGIGFRVLEANTNGASESIIIGDLAFKDNTTGTKNLSIGHYSNNVTGQENATAGIHSFESNYSGSFNAGIGNSILRWNQRGSFNSALGNGASYLASTVISSISFTAGSGYTDGTYPLTISAPSSSVIPGIPSVQAVGTATISGGSVVSTSVTTQGNNYGGATSPTVTLSGAGAGTGATFTAVLTSAAYNTAVGSAALVYNESGSYNVAVGVEAGYGAGGNEATLKDDYMTFLGTESSRHSSIARTTKISKSTAIGYNAKVSIDNALVLGGTSSDAVNVGINTHAPRAKLDIVSGDALIHELTVGRGLGSVITNTAFGIDALDSNTSGSNNVVLGYGASKNSTTGLLNIIIGVDAHQGNGAHNVAIGYNALKNAGTAGFVNSMVAIGSVAIGNGTGSWGSIAIGHEAMYNNTTTSPANVYDWNTAIGHKAAFDLTNGRFNTYLGAGSGYNTTTGDFNTGIGVASMGSGLLSISNVLTGDLNTAVGYNSGSALTSGSGNVILGSNTGSTIATLSNHILIADGAGTQRLLINNNGAYTIGGGFGTAGQVLTSNGDASPTWEDAGAIATPGIDDVLAVGQALTANRSIATGAFNLTVSTATAAVVPLVVTATTGVGISTSTTSGAALLANSTAGVGAQISSDSGSYAASLRGYSAATNNTVIPTVQIYALNGAAPSAAGFGAQLDFNLMTTNFATSGIANSVISKWTDATHATRSSSMILQGVESAVTYQLVEFDSAGTTTFGVAGTNAGKIALTGVTSGTATIETPAAAGTPTLTLPTVSGTLVQYSDTNIASSATPTPTGDARENNFDVTALAAGATFAAPSGTPANHNTLLIRIKDNGGAQTLAWNAIYRAGTDFSLPTTTVAGETMYVQFVYNSADSVWDCTGLSQGY